MLVAILGLAVLTMTPALPSRLRCFDDGVAVKKGVRVQIDAAVRRCSRFPVVRLEVIDPKEHAPAGTIAALTVIRGECGNATGDIFWVHRGVHGWRVLTKASICGVISASAS